MPLTKRQLFLHTPWEIPHLNIYPIKYWLKNTGFSTPHTHPPFIPFILRTRSITKKRPQNWFSPIPHQINTVDLPTQNLFTPPICNPKYPTPPPPPPLNSWLGTTVMRKFITVLLKLYVDEYFKTKKAENDKQINGISLTGHIGKNNATCQHVTRSGYLQMHPTSAPDHLKFGGTYNKRFMVRLPNRPQSMLSRL